METGMSVDRKWHIGGKATVRAYDVLVLHVLDNFSILAMSKPIFSTVITIIC